jgi:hypothetical protein
MRFIFFISAVLFFWEFSYSQAGNKKVVLSDSSNSIEFTPYSNQVNGVLIEPLNNIDGKGINTTFYLRDTSFWSFYTNASNRLSIKGDGSIVATGPLLINNAVYDGRSSLRVNGQARFDTSVLIKASSLSDYNAFISLERNIKGLSEPDDSISPYATTPIQWANGNNIPVFRIRHPNIVSYQQNINTSLQRDFKIYPYEYGMNIDYNGIVECWVGEWSIHRGLGYYDAEGKGNGWGGVLWVGDDHDLGGVRATARNNELLTGTVMYGELSVEKFNTTSNGDFRFRLPSNQDQFHFVYGGRGSNNIVAKISDKGFYLPKISTDTLSASPEAAQIAFDSTDKKFKAYNGTQWITLDESTVTGSYTLTSNGSNVEFNIPHSLGSAPSYFNVIATSAAAANISYVTANASNLVIHYVQPPAVSNADNLSWNWQVKK